jgi:hypothetical protein
MVIPDDNSPSFASLMDLNMMPGREQALKEYKLLLDASGLKFARVLPTRSQFQILTQRASVRCTLAGCEWMLSMSAVVGARACRPQPPPALAASRRCHLQARQRDRI